MGRGEVDFFASGRLPRLMQGPCMTLTTLRLGKGWVPVKEFRLSYHNGWMVIKLAWVLHYDNSFKSSSTSFSQEGVVLVYYGKAIL